jgi:exosortase family protein XrtF
MRQLFMEFKPALFFLGKFLAIYFIGNIVYGIYVESFVTKPDTVTQAVSYQTVKLLNLCGYQSSAADHASEPKVAIKNNGVVVLSVFEGCNGLNVVIVFIAFLVAFGGPPKKMVIFLFIGVITIHFINLLRIAVLFYLAQHNTQQFYYFHKYFFTATLYLVVFGLWAIWVIRFNERKGKTKA